MESKGSNINSALLWTNKAILKYAVIWPEAWDVQATDGGKNSFVSIITGLEPVAIGQLAVNI